MPTITVPRPSDVSPKLHAADFKRVIEGGRRAGGRAMVLYVLPRAGTRRAGFVCGKRVGGAVVRNRARRRLKEAWRQLAPRVRDELDVVIVGRGAARSARFADLATEMEDLLVELEVLER